MTKYLQVEMPNKERWLVPASIIAKNRAEYYAFKETLSEGDFDKIFKEEYEYTLGDAYEIHNWASNNMNWNEVFEYAKCIGVKEMTERDYREGWMNGEHEIVEVEDDE